MDVNYFTRAGANPGMGAMGTEPHTSPGMPGGGFNTGFGMPAAAPHGNVGDANMLYRRNQVNEASKCQPLTTVDAAIASLEAELCAKVVPMDPRNMEVLSRDPTTMALAALKRVREEAQQRKVKRFGFWFGFWAILIALCFIVKGVVAENLVVGETTVPFQCSVPWGPKEKVDVVRYITYPTKTLFGYQLVDHSDPKTRIEVKLPGDAITILGSDNRISEKHPKSTFWRMNYTKGEFGTVKLKYADQLWLVGEKDKTTLINRDTFCK